MASNKLKAAMARSIAEELEKPEPDIIFIRRQMRQLILQLIPMGITPQSMLTEH